MKLDLYMFPSCPYCRRVMAMIDASGRKDVVYHNIRANETDRETLILVGGKEQVPCLFIDGKPMYESQDIIDWLVAHPQM